MIAANRWLNTIDRMQFTLLFIWLAFVCLLPENVYGLLSLGLLVPVWVIALIVGAWNLATQPKQRLHALWVMLAFPLTMALYSLLSGLEALPLVRPPTGPVWFLGVLLAYPLYLVGRWLLRTTSPEEGAPAQDRLSKIFLLTAAALMALSVLLATLLFLSATNESAQRGMGAGWWGSALTANAFATAILSPFAGAYALLGLLRRSRSARTMLSILGCLTVAVATVTGTYFALAVMAAG